VALAAVAVCGNAKAGYFSLDNKPAMAFDVADTGAPAPAAVDPSAAKLQALMQEIAQLKTQIQANGAAQTRAALARQPRVAATSDLNAALNQTTGQCSNGQCGR
jgi:hypothetical protein